MGSKGIIISSIAILFISRQGIIILCIISSIFLAVPQVSASAALFACIEVFLRAATVNPLGSSKATKQEERVAARVYPRLECLSRFSFGHKSSQLPPSKLHIFPFSTNLSQSYPQLKTSWSLNEMLVGIDPKPRQFTYVGTTQRRTNYDNTTPMPDIMTITPSSVWFPVSTSPRLLEHNKFKVISGTLRSCVFVCETIVKERGVSWMMFTANGDWQLSITVPGKGKTGNLRGHSTPYLRQPLLFLLQNLLEFL